MQNLICKFWIWDSVYPIYTTHSNDNCVHNNWSMARLVINVLLARWVLLKGFNSPLCIKLTSTRSPSLRALVSWTASWTLPSSRWGDWRTPSQRRAGSRQCGAWAEWSPISWEEGVAPSPLTCQVTRGEEGGTRRRKYLSRLFLRREVFDNLEQFYGEFLIFS